MKKILILFWIIVAILSLIYCEYSLNQSIRFKNDRLYKWNNEISLPFPAPKTKLFEVSYSGSVMCRGMTETKFADYLKTLKNSGWELLDSSLDGGLHTIYSVLIKDNMQITILDQTYVYDSPSLDNYIDIEFTNGHTLIGANGRLSKSKAKGLIRKYIDTLTEETGFGYGKRVYRLVELYIEDSFEKMGLQAFKAYDENGTICKYLVCNGTVCEAPFLGDTLVVDIDKDNKYELISFCGWGSGRYRTSLVAYKFGKHPDDKSNSEVIFPAYYNSYISSKISTGGYDDLILKKISNTEVEVFDAMKEKGKLIPGTDYGLLKAEGTSLYCDAENFPFKEW